MCGASPWRAASSNLKQLFASGQEFTYGMEISRATTAPISSSCATGTRCFPGGFCGAATKTLVEDLEGNVRRILDFCGLEFEPACASSIRPNAVSARPARSRSASPFSATGSSSGRTTSPGSARSSTVCTMHLFVTVNRPRRQRITCCGRSAINPVVHVDIFHLQEAPLRRRRNPVGKESPIGRGRTLSGAACGLTFLSQA